MESRKIKNFLAEGIIFIMVLGGIIIARAGVPTDQVKEKADEIINILNDPAFQEKKEERKNLIINIIDEMVDWEEIAKRSLGLHWKKITSPEQEEFVSLFKELLRRSYANKLDLYAGEVILYQDEKIEGEYAVVSAKIINKKKEREIAVDFRLINKGKRWLIYDLFIEGVSTVNNYRIQFNEIIVSSSYEDLVKKLKEKQASGTMLYPEAKSKSI